MWLRLGNRVGEQVQARGARPRPVTAVPASALRHKPARAWRHSGARLGTPNWDVELRMRVGAPVCRAGCGRGESGEPLPLRRTETHDELEIGSGVPPVTQQNAPRCRCVAARVAARKLPAHGGAAGQLARRGQASTARFGAFDRDLFRCLGLDATYIRRCVERERS